MRAAMMVVVALMAMSPAHAETKDEATRFKEAITSFLASEASGVDVTGIMVNEVDGHLVASVPALTITDAQASFTVGAFSITKVGEREGGRIIDTTIAGPERVEGNILGNEVSAALTHARGSAAIDTERGRSVKTRFDIDGMTVQIPDAKGQVAIVKAWSEGGLDLDAKGAWVTSTTGGLEHIEIMFDGVSPGSTSNRVMIDGMAFESHSNGANFTAYQHFIDNLGKLGDTPGQTPDGNIFANLTAGLHEAGTGVKLTGIKMEGISNQADAETATIKSLELKTVVSGIDQKAASLRLIYQHEDFAAASAPADIASVLPRRTHFDLEIGDIDTQELMNALVGGKDATGAVAVMAVVAKAQLLVHDLSLEGDAASLSAKGEARFSSGTPLNLTGEGDVLVRGIQAIADLQNPFSAEISDILPIFEALGSPQQNPQHGDKELRYRIEATPAGELLVNGADLSVLVGAEEAPADKAGQRALLPRDPAMEGEDVKKIQKALLDRHLLTDLTGRYDPTTAAAVIRFQKQVKLNADGVVNEATRAALLK
ncbi:MAG TPA: peptidoglycan-binding domain-containing protein [Stellaceae bacterium]|nr:peptidoglycan-binding domain-containing protein [Stellaceae bacterium]